MSPNNQYLHSFSADDHAELLADSNILSLSIRSGDNEDLDGFDFSLDDSNHMDYGILTDSKTFAEYILDDSFKMEELNLDDDEEAKLMMESCPALFDSPGADYPIQEKAPVHLLTPKRNCLSRRHSEPVKAVTPTSRPSHICPVKFDPTPYNHEQFQDQMHQEEQRYHEEQQSRRVSYHEDFASSDGQLFKGGSGYEDFASSDGQLLTTTPASSGYHRQVSHQYQEQNPQSCCEDFASSDSQLLGIMEDYAAPAENPLSKLEELKKRSEWSRRQLQSHVMANPSPQPNHHHQQRMDGGRPASMNMAAFFSGRRHSLTDGLEHSRNQLRMYTDQVISQTLS